MSIFSFILSHFGGMFFHLIGVKEVINEKYNVDLIVESISLLLVRKIFEEKQVIIISLFQYDKDPIKFGNVNFTIKYKEQFVKCIVSGGENIDIESIKNICVTYLSLGLDIIDINSSLLNLSLEQIQNLINEVKQSLEKKEQQQESFLKNKQTEQQLMYQDKKLIEMKELLQETLDIIDEIENRTVQYVDGDKLKHLRNLRDDLSKIRLGTNKAKIKDLLGQIYTLIEEVNNDYFAHPDVISQQNNVLENSLLTDQNVFFEESKFFKSQIVKDLELDQSLNDKYYIFIGKLGIFLSFFKKDIFDVFRDWKLIIYRLYDIIEYLLSVIVVFVIIIFFFNEKILGINENLSAYYMLVRVGLFGFLFFLVKQYIYKYNYKNIIVLISAFPVLYIIYIILISLIRHSFAL